MTGVATHARVPPLVLELAVVFRYVSQNTPLGTGVELAHDAARRSLFGSARSADAFARRRATVSRRTDASNASLVVVAHQPGGFPLFGVVAPPPPFRGRSRLSPFIFIMPMSSKPVCFST